MADNTISTAIDFLNKVRTEDEVTILFIKQDGSSRTMRCTLNFDKIPEKDKPKDINLPKILKLLNQNKIIHVYDLEKRGWRSVPFEKTKWLETPKQQRFLIKK